MSVREFLYEKCKILDSKKLPLWLTMKSAELKEEAELYKDAATIHTNTMKDKEVL